MADETYAQRRERLRIQNELNRQRAMQGAGAGAAAAEKARREREWLFNELAEMQKAQLQGKNQAATVTNTGNSIDSIPGQFSNVIQTVSPPAPSRAGEGIQQSRTGAVPGIVGSGTVGNIDWSVTPLYTDPKTQQLRILPSNNNSETGMTDDEFKLAWARQYAVGKDEPRFGERALKGLLSFGAEPAPSKSEALQLLREKNQFTGALETPEVREGRERRAREQAEKERVSQALKELYPVEQEVTRGPNFGDRFVDFLTGPDDAQNQRIRGDSVAQGNQTAGLSPEQLYDMEMDDPTRRGTITPRIALTPEQQFEQQLQAEAAATAAAPAGLSLKEQQDIQMQGVSKGDAQQALRAGEGGQTRGGLTGAESVDVQTRAPRPAEVILPPEEEVEQLSTDGVWTPEMWRAAGYTMQPDGSWDIVSPPSPAPAAAAEVASVPLAINEGNILPSGPEVPRVIDTSVKDEPERRDREKVFEEYRTGDTLEVDGQYGISGDDIDNQYGGVTTPVVTSPAATAMPAATAVNMAGGQNPWGTMMQASLSPREMWQQYRMQQFGDAPLGAQLAAQRNMDIGYEPAMGRYMLGQAAGRIAPSATAFTPGERFGEYIRGGQRADLDELRRNYQMLGSALGAYGTGGTPAAGTAGYLDVFGDPSDPSRLRGNVLQATRAALGTNAFTGGGALGNIYDVMQRQYGAGGAGRFADWVGTAFQPQQQQPLFQQPANRGKTPQLLGTETLNSPEQRYDRKWEETGGEAYWSPWQMQGAM